MTTSILFGPYFDVFEGADERILGRYRNSIVGNVLEHPIMQQRLMRLSECVNFDLASVPNWPVDEIPGRMFEMFQYAANLSAAEILATINRPVRVGYYSSGIYCAMAFSGVASEDVALVDLLETFRRYAHRAHKLGRRGKVYSFLVVGGNGHLCEQEIESVIRTVCGKRRAYVRDIRGVGRFIVTCRQDVVADLKRSISERFPEVKLGISQKAYGSHGPFVRDRWVHWRVRRVRLSPSRMEVVTGYGEVLPIGCSVERIRSAIIRSNMGPMNTLAALERMNAGPEGLVWIGGPNPREIVKSVWGRDSAAVDSVCYI